MFEDSPYCILHNILLSNTKSLITNESAKESIDGRIKKYQKNAVPMFKEDSFKGNYTKICKVIINSVKIFHRKAKIVNTCSGMVMR